MSTPTLDLTTLPYRACPGDRPGANPWGWLFEQMIDMWIDTGGSPVPWTVLAWMRPDLGEEALYDEIRNLIVLSGQVAELRDQHSGRWVELDALTDRYE